MNYYIMLYYIFYAFLGIFGGRNTFILPILRSVLEKKKIFFIWIQKLKTCQCLVSMSDLLSIQIENYFCLKTIQ